MISGATRFPVSRRARRPLSQSSQLMGRPFGVVGTGFSEFMRNFSDEFFQLRKDGILGSLGKSAQFLPIHLDVFRKRHGNELARTSGVASLNPSLHAFIAPRWMG